MANSKPWQVRLGDRVLHEKSTRQAAINVADIEARGFVARHSQFLLEVHNRRSGEVWRRYRRGGWHRITAPATAGAA